MRFFTVSLLCVTPSIVVSSSFNILPRLNAALVGAQTLTVAMEAQLLNAALGYLICTGRSSSSASCIDPLASLTSQSSSAVSTVPSTTTSTLSTSSSSSRTSVTISPTTPTATSISGTIKLTTNATDYYFSAALESTGFNSDPSTANNFTILTPGGACRNTSTFDLITGPLPDTSLEVKMGIYNGSGPSYLSAFTRGDDPLVTHSVVALPLTSLQTSNPYYFNSTTKAVESTIWSFENCDPLNAILSLTWTGTNGTQQKLVPCAIFSNSIFVQSIAVTPGLNETVAQTCQTVAPFSNRVSVLPLTIQFLPSISSSVNF